MSFYTFKMYVHARHILPKYARLLMCVLLLLATGFVKAQVGNVIADPSFDTPGAGVNSTIESFAIQPDSKVLIGGYFTSFNGTTRYYIARLNADGSLDTTFNPGTGTNSSVHSIVVQPDGKVLIGGPFSTFNGMPRNRIARLNADGSLDTAFDPGSGPDSLIRTVAVQPDDKVLIAGDFTTFNGTPRNRIARLNADGSLDTTFDPGTGANSAIRTVVVQPDSRVLIGGAFAAFNGMPRNRIARLNADGSLDTTFDPGTGANSVIYTNIMQPDGKLLIGGLFTTFNDTSRNYVARLNADGSLDTAFDPGTGADDWVQTFAIQPNGKVLIGGRFTTFNGMPRNRIARLNADGSLDAAFDPGTGADDRVQTLAIQPDGRVLTGGDFTTFNSTPRNRIARLSFPVTVTSLITGGNGTISPSGMQSVTVATSVIFTLTPSAGYVVDYVDGTCGGTLSGNVFTATATDCTVVAHFRLAGSVQPVPLLNSWLLAGLTILLGLFGGLYRRLYNRTK